jgi:hypothetical protein
MSEVFEKLIQRGQGALDPALFDGKTVVLSNRAGYFAVCAFQMHLTFGWKWMGIFHENP